MSFRSMRVAVCALLPGLLLSGCTAAVLINAANEQDNVAKTFSPPDDMSLIYVYLAKPNRNLFNHVVIDGRIAGMARPSFYSVSNVPPGRHRVGLGSVETDSLLLNAEPGKAYFIDAHVSCDDGTSHAQLRLVDDSTGRQHVLDSSLANITLFGTPLLNDSPTGVCSLPVGNV